MSKLYTKFVNIIKKHRLLPRNDRLIAGVSGGVDSMVMLDLLKKYQKAKANSFELIAAHINHMTRAGQSNQDQKLVEKYCQKHSIPIKVRKVDVPKMAQESRQSFEMVARNIRYDFFGELAGDGRISTAHTLDDHIETILHRILKGTGLKGLSGIQYKAGNVIHPLRFATKQDLYDYAGENDIDFNEDHTNYENHCERNVLRNTIIPEIQKEINSGYRDAIHRLSQIAQESDDFLTQSAQEKLLKIITKSSSWYHILAIEKLKSLHPALIKKIIYLACHQLRPYVALEFASFAQILEQLSRKNEGQIINLGSGLSANFDRDRLVIFDKKLQNWDNKKIEIGEDYQTDSFTFKIEPAENSWNKGTDHNVEFIDRDKIDGNLAIRHWQSGDKFQPVNFGHTKKLSDLFIDEKIGKFRKHQIPILVDDNNIIWVCGIRLSDRYKIDKNTSNILKLEYYER